MSGIAGIVRFDAGPIEPGLVEKMTAAMAHRGPDGIRHWRKGSVALGQCMLHTTPESLEETQPLPNEDESLVLVMDGRVDNWEELRRELLGRGAVLRDRSDAELVLRAYETWGRECLPHIDGDFALVIWDARRQQVFCARDRMGNKPFNYHWDGKTLTFSSELHAILAMSWIRQELNEGMLTEYLTIDWHSHDETPWKGIHRLVQAHWMAFGHGGQQSGQYWQPDFHSPLLYASDEEYVEHYRALLTDTVRRMSRTHRVLACEVSGGLDSSALFAVAADLRRKQGLPAPGLSGFTLRFDSDCEANELAYARAVGAHVGVPVHEVDPTHKPLSWYRDWARTYKEFPGYPNGVMGWDIRKVAREQGSRVLLVGVGGDEWLTGRRYYHAEELASGRWRNLYRCMQADLRDLGAKSLLWSLGRSVAVRVLPAVAQRILRTLLARTRRASISHDSWSWLVPELREVASQRKTRFGSPSHGIAFGRAGQLAQYRMLHASYNVLARESEERFSARLGVELRLPLWGTAMVQFAFSTPERLRRNGGMTKVLHRRAMAGLLPSSVLERTTKAQFMTTFSSYADELRDAFAAHMLKNRLKWVLPERLQEKHSQFGVASFHAAPEWMLWGLFGCMALLPEGES